MACAILCSSLCVILTFVLGFAGFILFPLILLTVGQVSAPSSLQEPQELLPEHQMTIISPFPTVFRCILYRTASPDVGLHSSFRLPRCFAPHGLLQNPLHHF